MAIDLTILQLAKERGHFNRIFPILPTDVDEHTRRVMELFGEYYRRFPDHKKIDMTVLMPSIPRWARDLDADQVGVYERLCSLALKDADPAVAKSLLNDLFEIDTANKIAGLIAQHQAGDLDAPLHIAIENTVSAYKRNIGVREVDWVDVDIGTILEQEENNSGVQYRLTCLRNSMRSLRPGDFGIIGGRVDRGKTTFVASEITHWANQLPADRNILWINNEGPGARIVPRLYQAALGVTVPELVEMNQAKKLVDAYCEVVGRRDRIRVVDAQGFSMAQVEAAMEAHNAGVVVFDMLDNVRGASAERTDLYLERLYQYGRELQVKYNCIGIATSQQSADAVGLIYPDMHMLKDSKTGKQGAADFIIMIGCSDDVALQNTRFISTPKNKLARFGKKTDPRAEVVFKPHIARFEDPPILGTPPDE